MLFVKYVYQIYEYKSRRTASVAGAPALYTLSAHPRTLSNEIFSPIFRPVHYQVICLLDYIDFASWQQVERINVKRSACQGRNRKSHTGGCRGENTPGRHADTPKPADASPPSWVQTAHSSTDLSLWCRCSVSPKNSADPILQNNPACVSQSCVS